MTEKSIEQLYAKAYKDLLAVNRKSSLLDLARIMLYVFLFTAALLLLYVILDLAFNISVPVRISYWVILFSGLAYVVFRYAIPELRRAFAPSDNELFAMARKIGKQDEDVQDAIINFLQIYDTRKSESANPFRSLLPIWLPRRKWISASAMPSSRSSGSKRRRPPPPRTGWGRSSMGAAASPVISMI